MKKALFTFLFAFLSVSSIWAQVTWEHDTVYNYGTAVNGYNDFPAYNKITNSSYENDTFKWIRTRVSGPNDWQSGVCDLILCHDSIVDSATFYIKKDETGEFSFHFYSHNGNAGHIEMDVYVFNITDRANGNTTTAIYNAWATTSNEIKPNSIRIYPNPVSSSLNLELPSKAPLGIKMNVINVLGQNVKTFTFNGNKAYDVSSLDKGIYFLKFEIHGKSFIKKFQKAK